MKSNYLFTQLSTFDYFNVIFNATLLNLLVYKEEEKNTQKLVKLLGVIFFSLELNCLVIWRIFLVVNLAAEVDLELIANFG